MIARKKFHDETMAFRKLTRKEKFDSLLELCQKLGHIPKSYDSKKYVPDAYTKVRAQFYVNMTSARSRGDLCEADLAQLSTVEAFNHSRLSREDKINLVTNYWNKYNVLPTKYDDPDTFEVLKSIKNMTLDGLTEDYIKSYTDLVDIIKKSRKTLIERLTIIHDFCQLRNRTPKQHSLDINEKQLADTLSSIKQRMKKIPFTKDEQLLYNKIIEYAPPPRRVHK
jgi:hypothetical protein